MHRVSLRLLHCFSKRLNTPVIYNTQALPSTTSKYLVGDIINNRYLNEQWRGLINSSVNVAGWVRNVRVSNQVMFINLFDGTAAKEIQVVIGKDHPDWGKYIEIKKGYSLKISGTLK